MLRWRLMSAALLITVLLAVLFLDYHTPAAPGIWLLPIAWLLPLLAVRELLDMFSSRQWYPSAGACYTGTLLVIVLASVPTLAPWLPAAWGPRLMTAPAGAAVGTVLGVMLVFGVEIRRYRAAASAVLPLSLAVLVIVYAGLLFSFLIALRLWGGHTRGLVALLTMIVIVKVSDTGAYAFGRMLGRRKLAPLVSPGKTVAGAVGALASGGLAALWGGPLLVERLVEDAVLSPQPLAWFVYGLTITLAGMLGDLGESLIKRDLQRKDSGSLLPGMGGVLDVLDSLLFAAPIAYFLWQSGLLGPM